MNRSLLQTLIVFVISTLSTVAAATQDGTRTWKSTNGKFSIEASLESRDGDTLLLKNTEGKTIKVSLSKLSDADQAFVRELDAESTKPWKPAKDAKVEIKWGSSWYPGEILEVQGDDAFLIHYSKYSNDTWDEVVTRDRIRQPGATGESESKSRSETGADTKASPKASPKANYAITSGDTSAAKIVSISDQAWRLATITPLELADLGNVKIKLRTAPERISSAVYALNESQTMGYLGVQNGIKDKHPQLTAFDLTKGQLLGTTELPIPNNYFRDINADGSKLLSSSGKNWPDRNRVDWWKIKVDGTLDHLGGIELESKVSNASFTSTGNLLVQDIWGEVTVWNVEQEEPKVIFSLPSLGMNADVMLSQDKKILFGSTSKKIFAIDLASGTCLGSIDHHLPPGPIAVTRDHSRVALSAKNRVLVWNNAGEKLADFYVSGSYRKIRWMDDRYLIAGNRIIDTQSRIELCTLTMPWWFRIDGRSDFWMFDSDTMKFGNAPTTMPKLKTLVPTDLEDHFVLKDGDTVALDIEFSLPPNVREEIETSLKKQFEKRGVVISSRSEVRIKMTQKTSTVTEEYRDRSTGTVSSVTAKRYQRTMSLVKGDKILFSFDDFVGRALGTIMKEQDETMQQAADRIRPKLTYDFFKAISLPDHIAIHPEDKPFSKATFDSF